MFRLLALFSIAGVLLFGVSCAETPTEEPEPEAAPVAEAFNGPYYELTKDDITGHADWTSRNVTLKGVKIGDNGRDSESALGKVDKTEPVGVDYYRSVFEKSSFALYTQKMTGEIHKVEIYGTMADKIADPKFKKLLTGGSLDYMREAFGMEEKAEINFDTTAMEYYYDAKGFRFAQYNLGGTAVNAIIFSKIKT